jgi:hypothetical protein
MVKKWICILIVKILDYFFPADMSLARYLEEKEEKEKRKI